MDGWMGPLLHGMVPYPGPGYGLLHGNVVAPTDYSYRTDCRLPIRADPYPIRWRTASLARVREWLGPFLLADAAEEVRRVMRCI